MCFALKAEIQNAVLTLRVSFDVPVRRARNIPYFSAEAQDFISALLQRDPENRLSAQLAMKHPWLSDSTTTQKQSRRRNRRRVGNQKGEMADIAHRIKEFSALPKVKRTILAALAKQLTEEQVRSGLPFLFVCDLFAHMNECTCLPTGQSPNSFVSKGGRQP